MESFFITKNTLVKIRNNILYIFGLCAIITFSTLYVFSQKNIKYAFNLDLSIKDELNKEITYIHLKQAIYDNIVFDTPSLRLNTFFNEFGYNIQNEIEKKVGCLTFLKHESKPSNHVIKIFCRTTNKSEKFLYDEIIKIYTENEKFYINKYNKVVDVFLLAFVSKGDAEKNWDVFHIKNLSNYDLRVYKIENEQGLLLTSVVFSITLSLLIYLLVNLILNLRYKK